MKFKVSLVAVLGLLVSVSLAMDEPPAPPPPGGLGGLPGNLDIPGDIGNTPDGKPHVPGENPCVSHPGLPTRGGKGPTLGIFIPEQETKVEIPLTSDPPKDPNGNLTGPGIDCQSDVVCQFIDQNPGATEREIKNVRVSCEHTEGHAACILRRNPDCNRGTIYINNEPCGFCTNGIPDVLNPGQVLVVVYPKPDGMGGFVKETKHWVGGKDGLQDGDGKK